MDHHRRSIRLPQFDYRSAGAYFVTICTHERAHVFGEIQDGKMILNALGQVAVSTWDWLQTHHPFIQLDDFVVMPDHVHGIIWFVDPQRRGGSRTAPTQITPTPTAPANKPLGRIIGAFKTVSSKQIHALKPHMGQVWQRNYHERIIRNESELNAIRQYIRNNPAKWNLDDHHSL